MNLDELSEIARSELWAFPKLVSDNKCPPHCVFIAEKVLNKIKSKPGKKKMLIFSGPPRHGKSELLPIHAPPFLLGNFPKLRIIIAAFSASLAEDHSAKGKEIFEEWGPLLWGIKPHAKVFGREKWNTEYGGGVKAAGIGGGISGFGADVMFIDDYHPGRKEAESQLQRDTVWDWWKSAAARRLHPNATVIIFATRWHDDDLVGRLLKQYELLGEEDFPFDFEYINLPAVAEEEDALGRKEGEALWPWWMDEEALRHEKTSAGSYEWSALYQGSPTVRGGTLFKSQYFRYYTFDPMTKEYVCYRKDIAEPIRIKKTDLTRHVYCDPSLEIKTTNDPTGAAAWGYSRRYKVWLLLDRLNGRIEHTQVMDRLKLFAFKNSCTKIGIENEKLGKVLVKQSAGKDSVGGVKIPFVEIPTGGLDKYARATPMAGYIENERVFFPKDAPWLSQYESALVKFPNDKHDEDVDITSMAENMESRKTLAEVLAGK